MLKIGIIIGSTRPNRIAPGVAEWVYNEAGKRKDAEFELVDLMDFGLPLLDEPVPPGMSSNYTHDHTKKWSEKISSLDAFIFITPEYNHAPSGALKNAIDFLYQEWNNKVAGFVGYGSLGAARAVEILRIVMAELQVATVRTQLAFFLRNDFENFQTLKTATHHVKTLNILIDQIIFWGEALKEKRLEKQEETPVIKPRKRETEQRREIH